MVESNGRISYSTIRQVSFEFYVKDFTIYPNPAKSAITITGNFPTPASMQIVDHSGKIVFIKKLLEPQSMIALPVLAKGVYLVRVNEKIKKLVVY